MTDWKRRTAFCIGIGVSLWMTACGGGGSTVSTQTYTLTVSSTNPASGVAITVSPADNNSAANGSTSFTRTYDAGTSVTLTAPAASGSDTFTSWTGCTSTSGETCTVMMSANTAVTANYAVPVTTYTLTVNSTNPASGVTIDYNNPLNNVIIPGTTSFTASETAGTILNLTAPASVGSNSFSSWTGCTSTSGTGGAVCSVTLNANATVTANYTIVKTTPTVTVTPGSSSIATTQPLTVTVAVSGSGATPTGSVTLTGGGYASTATALSGGSAQIDIPASSLTAGSDTFTATYTPDASSSAAYNSTSGTSTAVTVTTPSTVTISTPNTTTAVTDQILGMNMGMWYDQSTSAILPAFATAGIKAIRWPGGSASDYYHWATNSECFGASYVATNTDFSTVVSDLITPGKLDLALTANYGTDSACTGGGDPTEAAAWVAQAKTLGANLSHMTVGNEEYGSWEEDLHSAQHDGPTYAAATVNGYYPDIKAADSSVKVGVDVEPAYAPWDQDVMSGAKGYYDFVEYHYYPETPGSESDSFLVNTAAQQLTTNINTIKAELVKWGTPGTPIYVGEIGGPYTNPGKQSWSITQGLYAGQVLGEMMNSGVTRLTWWIGFGGCEDSLSGQGANFSSSLYGWQDFGGYMVFSDGLPDYNNCKNETLAAGTLSPTARAFQLFSNVAVNGESVLTASVAGDTADVVAYAATHGGGTALVLFNRNETASKPVEITISGQSSATTVTEITYDKALYDQTDATTPVWAAPTTTNLGAQSLPLTLMLTPWSMNVVILQ